MLGPNIRPQVPTWGYARRAITGADTITASDRGYVVDATSGTFSLALTAGATLGTGFEVAVYNSGTGIVTVDPDGAETILLPTGSASTVALGQGMGFLLMWNGTVWEAIASSGFGPHGSLYTASRIVQTDTTGALATPSALATSQSLSLTNASGIQTQQASTQDAIRLLGSGAGSSSRIATITSVTLGASRTYTFPDSTTTIAGLAVAQTFTANQIIQGTLSVGTGAPAATSVSLVYSNDTNVSNTQGLTIRQASTGDAVLQLSNPSFRFAWGIDTSSGLMKMCNASGLSDLLGDDTRTLLQFDQSTSIVTLCCSAAGSLTVRQNASFAGNALSTSATAGVGYGTGAGGTVAQGSGSGKATGVTLNKVCGTITMDGANLNADTTVAFTFTNSAIAATDLVVIQHSSVGTLGAYNFAVTPAGGSATVSVRNVTPGNLAEAIVLRFAIIKAVTA